MHAVEIHREKEERKRKKEMGGKERRIWLERRTTKMEIWKERGRKIYRENSKWQNE